MLTCQSVPVGEGVAVDYDADGGACCGALGAVRPCWTADHDGPNGGANSSILGDVQSDSLLALIAMANADPGPDKIDVGVGVYRDGVGNTPILRAVKAAEKRLWETQQTRATSAASATTFIELLRPICSAAMRRRPRRWVAYARRLRRAQPGSS